MSTHHQLSFWILFNLAVLALLVLDLSVFHRRAHTIRFREALLSSAAWIALAAAFAVGVYFWMGHAKGLEFTTAYLVEESLSIDNLFVILLIFRYFRVPGEYQHRVLFWGILGALVMRGLFIAGGVAMIQHFHWIVYLFGAFLVFTGGKLALAGKTEVHPEKNFLLRAFRRWFPVTPDYVDGNFFVRRGSLSATPLFLALLAVEGSDILFAADSIPAVLAVSRDTFIVYTSNVFAILGLRSLYFALAGMMEAFAYLHYGLSAILIFVGAKMLLSEIYVLPLGLALGVVAGVLLLSITLSLVFPPARSSKPNLVTPDD